MRAALFITLFAGLVLSGCGNPVTIHAAADSNDLTAVGSKISFDSSILGDRMVCIGGMAGTNLLTFFASSQDTAHPSNTLVLDPQNEEFTLIDLASPVLLSSTKGEKLRLVLTAKRISSGLLANPSNVTELYLLDLDRKMRRTSSLSLGRIKKPNERLGGMLKRLGLPARRHAIAAGGNSVLLFSDSGLEEILLGGEREAVILSEKTEFLANPLASESAILFDGVDEASGHLRKRVLWAGDSTLSSLPARSPNVDQFGGAFFAGSIFWFELSPAGLDLALLEGEKGGIARHLLLTKGRPLPGSIRTQIRDGALRVFYAADLGAFIEFRTAIFKDGAVIEENIATVSLEALGTRALKDSKLQFGISEDYQQVLFLDLSQESLSRVNGIDLSSAKVTRRSRASCREFAE